MCIFCLVTCVSISPVLIPANVGKLTEIETQTDCNENLRETIDSILTAPLIADSSEQCNDKQAGSLAKRALCLM